MSNTRFVLNNFVDAGTIKNGSGGGAPALDETSPFLMTRTQNGDRYSLWKTSSAGPSFYYDIDLGSAKSIDVAAWLGFSTIPANDILTVLVQYASSYYPGAWTNFATAGPIVGQRDIGLVVASPVSARYWRFKVTVGTATGITVGRMLLGSTVTYDLGGIHSPGGVENHFQNRLEQVMEDGSMNLNALGFSGADFAFPFNKVPTATRSKMRTIAAEEGSVVVVNADDEVYEVVITRGMASVGRHTSNLFDVGLEAKRLP